MKKIVLMTLLAPILTFAQEMDQYVIASQGDHSQSSEMSLSWTIGDFLTETAFIESGAFTQGFQQPFLEKQNDFRPDLLTQSENVVLEEQRDLFTNTMGSYDISVFPNPTEGIFNVEILSNDDVFFLEVLDATGKVVHQTQRSQNLNVLDLSSFEDGLYMLRISNSERSRSSTIRIIKI